MCVCVEVQRLLPDPGVRLQNAIFFPGFAPVESTLENATAPDDDVGGRDRIAKES